MEKEKKEQQRTKNKKKEITSPPSIKTSFFQIKTSPEVVPGENKLKKERKNKGKGGKPAKTEVLSVLRQVICPLTPESIVPVGCWLVKRFWEMQLFFSI